MSETITAYPLTWPVGWKRTERSKITKSRFGKSYWNPPTTYEATQLVLTELRRLGARDVIISSNVELRNDGLPRSGQKDPSDAGVAVYFQLNKQPRVLACDKWKSPGENLHAIALHISALRGQERWGVGTLEQAFTGYASLPAKTGQHWTEILGLPLSASVEDINRQYRHLVITKGAHPDHNGDAEEFHRLTEARDAALNEKGAS